MHTSDDMQVLKGRHLMRLERVHVGLDIYYDSRKYSDSCIVTFYIFASVPFAILGHQ